LRLADGTTGDKKPAEKAGRRYDSPRTQQRKKKRLKTKMETPRGFGRKIKDCANNVKIYGQSPHNSTFCSPGKGEYRRNENLLFYRIDLSQVRKCLAAENRDRYD
jgi:hypothetical protein